MEYLQTVPHEVILENNVRIIQHSLLLYLDILCMTSSLYKHYLSLKYWLLFEYPMGGKLIVIISCLFIL